ncbi:MAG: hypothetical protein HYX88_01685 [Chloroflexi bacterium]|nr:hypothetical protein [Chloroflexota bacterium]
MGGPDFDGQTVVAGRVGIGVDSPGYKLQIKHDNEPIALYIRNDGVTDRGNYLLLYAKDNGGTLQGAGIYFDPDYAGGGALLFGGAQYYNNLVVQQGPGGKVGIGTPSPGYKLDVNGPARQKPTISWTQDNGSTANYEDDKRTAYYSAYASKNVAMGIKWTNDLYYCLLRITADSAYVDYKITGTHMSSLYVEITVTNAADSVNRTAYIKYSLDNGATWSTIQSTFGAGETTLSTTINFANTIGGSVIVRFQIEGSPHDLVGWKNIKFQPTATSFAFVPRFGDLSVEGNVGISPGAWLQLNGPGGSDMGLQYDPAPKTLNVRNNVDGGDMYLTVRNGRIYFNQYGGANAGYVEVPSGNVRAGGNIGSLATGRVAVDSEGYCLYG